MLPNQPYYAPPGNYMPQYQNYQAQQRQEQLDQLYSRPYNYNFVRDVNEARNWPTAPGNHLVFEDQNGLYFYTKSLGFAPNERPVFVVYKREDYVEPASNQEQVEQNSFQTEIDNLKKDITEIRELLKQNVRPSNQNFKGKEVNHNVKQ